MKSLVNIMNEYNTSLKKIEDLVKELYSAISFSEQDKANFDRFKNLFKPDTRLIYFTKNSVEQLKLETFIIRLKEQIDKGNIKSFYEYELTKTVNKFGKIAHVFSTYETRDLPGSPKVLQRGINSIQLIFDEERWWITSLMWFNEDSKNELPEKYLPHLNKTENTP